MSYSRMSRLNVVALPGDSRPPGSAGLAPAHPCSHWSRLATPALRGVNACSGEHSVVRIFSAGPLPAHLWAALRHA